MKLSILTISLLVSFFSTTTESKAQVSMTYTFDSSVLSVLFGENEIMTVSNNSLLFDMRGKWKATKYDSVKMDLRGFYMKNYVDSVKGKKVKIRYKIFGKRVVVKTDTGDLVLSKTVSVKRLRRHPEVKVKVKGLTDENKGSVTIDSIDFEAVRKRDQ